MGRIVFPSVPEENWRNESTFLGPPLRCIARDVGPPEPQRLPEDTSRPSRRGEAQLRSRLPRHPQLPRRLHEHRSRADRGVRARPAQEQVRGHLHQGKQRALHQHAEEQEVNRCSSPTSPTTSSPPPPLSSSLSPGTTAPGWPGKCSETIRKKNRKRWRGSLSSSRAPRPSSTWAPPSTSSSPRSGSRPSSNSSSAARSWASAHQPSSS